MTDHRTDQTSDHAVAQDHDGDVSRRPAYERPDPEGRTTLTAERDPLRIVLVNDFEVVVRGLNDMLRPHGDRVRVVDLAVGHEPETTCDIALFDTFGGRRQALARARAMAEDEFVRHVVLYTWDANDGFVDMAVHAGIHGVVPKSASAEELIDALERISRGEPVGLPPAGTSRSGVSIDGLTTREREVLAMLGLGLSNRDIAHELFLGVETVRTYVRQIYQKLGVANRTQAALKARHLGLDPAEVRRSRAS